MKKLALGLIASFTFAAPTWSALGDQDRDLVFTPVTPCRIFDTRTSQGGTGPIPANGIKSFAVWGASSFASAGGSNTNCGITAGINTAAIAVNLTVVTPTTGGYVTAFPAGAAQPNAATVNFNAGDIRGNMAILKVGQNAAVPLSLSVFSTSATELVGDIVGFYSRPAATALECVEKIAEAQTAAPDNHNTSTAPACDAGYTQTSTSCVTNSTLAYITYLGGGHCTVRNKDTVSSQLQAVRTCCRIPGR